MLNYSIEKGEKQEGGNKMYQYRNIQTEEIVDEQEAESYVLDKLGITIEPRGKNGEMTQEQIENIGETVEWYFSGNWIKENKKEDGEANIFELLEEESELENGVQRN